MQVIAAICLHVCSTSGFCSSSGCSGSTQQPLKGTGCLQSLLTQCLSAYNSNQARLATMEKHLEQYGYSQQYSHPAPKDPFSQLSQPAPAGLPASSAQQVPSVACIQASAIGWLHFLAQQAAACRAGQATLLQTADSSDTSAAQGLPPSTAYSNFQAAINPPRPASAGADPAQSKYHLLKHQYPPADRSVLVLLCLCSLECMMAHTSSRCIPCHQTRICSLTLQCV